MLAKKTAKNQITLPKEVARNFPDTEYFDVVLDNNQIILRPVKIQPVPSDLEKVRLKMEELGVTEKDVEEAIAWSRRSAK